MQFLPRIKQADRRGRQHHHRRRRDHDGRAAHLGGAMQLSPEMCSLNMGSMNFALYPMAKRYKNWKYDWEESYLAELRRLHLPQHVPRHREDLQDCSARATASSSSTSATTSATSTISPIARPRHVQAAGLRAAHLRHSRRHRRRPRQSAVHEAHRRQAVRQGLSTGRCWPAAAIRCPSAPTPR